MLDIAMWIVTAAAIIGTVANVYQRWWSFAIWLPTNLAWVAFDLYIGAFHQAMLMAVYAGLAAWGLCRWSKLARQER